ncbi:MAG TPA: phosphatidylinositol mannoside acyltransferase [Euzebyales bacterium]
MTDRTDARPSAYRGTGMPGRGVDRRPGAAGRVPPRRPDTARQRAVGAMWLAAWQIVRWLPEAAAFGVADVAGRVAAWRGGAGSERLRANLGRVVDRDALDAAVVDAHRSYARYWVEAFRAADIGEDDIARRVTTDGFEHLDSVLDEGRGAVVLLAHHGSWDIAARWAEVHGYHLAVVAEIVRPRRLFARFVELREAMGLEVVPLEPRARIGGRGIGPRLGEVLAENHLVGLLTDRDLSGRAPLVDFFGSPCRIPIGATVLARRHDAPIVPITMLQRPGRRWHLQVLEPRRIHDMEIHDAQQQVAVALEEIIRLDPTQWHAFQPIWSRPTRSDGP